MRLFFGLQLSDDTRQMVGRQLNDLRAAAPEVVWVPPENLHLTLAFLGEVDEQALPALQGAARQVCRQIATINLSYHRQVGVFASWRRPQVLWLGVTDSDGTLGQLHQLLTEALALLGFVADQRWHPHITLGRVKRPLSADSQALIRQTVWSLSPERISGLNLFASTLRPTGPVYRTVATYLFDQCEK